MPDYKILVVDYEPRGLQQLREPLEKAGYTIRVAKDGLRAIEIFNETQPDLTVLEAMLPKKHGFEVCQEIKKTPHGTTTPVIIVTSVYKGRRYRTQALHHYGCDEYLEKPVPPDVLLETVRRLLERAHGATPRSGSSGSAAPEAEKEIEDRLDDLLGGTRTAKGDSPAGAGDEDEISIDEPESRANVVAFDPQRSRRVQSENDRSTEGATCVPPVRALGGSSAALPAIEYEPVTPRALDVPVPEPVEARPLLAPRAATSPAASARRQLAAGATAALLVALLLLFVLLRIS
jgi:DNA-binding response OmpR family regulator